MRNKIIKRKLNNLPLFVIVIFSILLFQLQIAGQEPLTFRDGQGNTIVFPLGAISFADRVVSVERGTSPATNSVALDSNAVLGVSDYDENSATYLSLGSNGSVTVEFTDNYLVDIDGFDLWIFEIGPLVESTKVAISKDGRTWTDVGIVEGSTSGIDIKPYVKNGDKFSFVRITDNNNASGEFAGADIEAIGAIGTIKREETPTAVVPVNNSTSPNNRKNDSLQNNRRTNKADCCNTLRIEMKDGTFQLIDLSKVKSMIPICNE